MNRPAAISQAHEQSSPLAQLRVRSLPIAWVQLALVVSPLLVIPFFRLVDPDFWWHLRTGELIVNDGLVRRDPFSWTAHGEPWVTHEWLSEALIYAVQMSFGYWANALLFGALAAATLLLGCAVGREAGAGTRVLVGCTALAVAILGTYATVRPQEFSWVLFAMFLLITQRHYQGASARVWALPPLMLLWANLHLGFFFGFAVLGAWCVGLAWDRLRGRPADLRTALLVSGACVVAAMLTPSGPAILLYPIRYLTDAGATHQYVAEWQSPSYLNPFHWPVFAGIGVLIASLVVPGRPRPFQLLLTVGIVVLAWQAVRNAPFVAVLLPAVAAPAFARTWHAASRERDADVRVPLPAAASMFGLTVAVMCAVMLSWNSSPSLGAPDERNFPSEGAAYVERNYEGRRLFNEYGWGGYLIYKLYPGTLVGIDGRTDFFGDRIMSDYYTIFRAEPGWQAALAKYDPEVVLVSVRSPVAEELRDDRAWVEELTTSRESIFVRREISQGGLDGN